MNGLTLIFTVTVGLEIAIILVLKQKYSGSYHSWYGHRERQTEPTTEKEKY